MVYQASIVEDFIYLLSCSLNNTKADCDKVSKMNLFDVFDLAEYHSLAACASFALENVGLENDIIKPWKQAKSMSIRKNIMLNEERTHIYNYMESEEIRYASLKGIIMQDYYPKFGMREMGDNDILYDSVYQEQMHDYMISRGYNVECYKKFYHDEYIKAPIYNFEFHNTLFLKSENKKIFDYYYNVFDRLVSVEGKKYELRFTDEDFYIYNVAHAYRHFTSSGGIGLRILTDCYVYIKSKLETLDFSYIKSECKKLGIDEFEYSCRNISLRIFTLNRIGFNDESNLSPDENEFLNRIIHSGTYGRHDFSVENKVNSIAKNSDNIRFTRLRYYIKRIFIPNEYIKEAYPFYYQHKILIPVLWIIRIFKALTINRKRIQSELKSVDDTIANMKK